MPRPEPIFPIMKDVELGRYFQPDCNHPFRTFEVKTYEWKHLARACFGPPRGSHGGLWTDDCYRYDIFVQDEDSSRAAIALRWWNGSGEGWLVAESRDHRGQSCLLAVIAANPCEELRWDACHFLYQTASDTAREAMRYAEQFVAKAFIEKRAKAKKKRGRDCYRVEIYTPSVEPGGGYSMKWLDVLTAGPVRRQPTSTP